MSHDSLGGKAKSRNGFSSRFGQETRIENGHEMEVKGKSCKKEFNKISGKLPKSTKVFKNEGAKLSGNGSLITTPPPFLGVQSYKEKLKESKTTGYNLVYQA